MPAAHGGTAGGRARRATAALALGASIAALGVTGCGDDDGDPVVRTVTVTTAAADTSPRQPAAPDPATSDAILIQTRITDARNHVSAIAAGSVMGESAFCRGGTISGSSDGPAITTTFHCPDGALTLKYAPPQAKLVQGNSWIIIRGTRRFKGLRGGGSMVAAFRGDDPDRGREVFTGTVGR